MKLSEFIQGLQILAPYFNGDGYHIGAEHDQFYVYTTDLPVSAAEQQKLLALGWFQPEGTFSSDGGAYDPGMGWSAFV